MKKFISNGCAEKVFKETIAKPGITFQNQTSKKGKVENGPQLQPRIQQPGLKQVFNTRPLLTNDLIGILMRFRQGQIALTCNIEGMFYQMCVKSNIGHIALPAVGRKWPFQGPQRFSHDHYCIWCYIFTMLCQIQAKKAADNYKEQFGKQAVKFIQYNFYVDDVLEFPK